MLQSSGAGGAGRAGGTAMRTCVSARRWCSESSTAASMSSTSPAGTISHSQQRRAPRRPAAARRTQPRRSPAFARRVWVIYWRPQEAAFCAVYTTGSASTSGMYLPEVATVFCPAGNVCNTEQNGYAIAFFRIQPAQTSPPDPLPSSLLHPPLRRPGSFYCITRQPWPPCRQLADVAITCAAAANWRAPNPACCWTGSRAPRRRRAA